MEHGLDRLYVPAIWCKSHKKYSPEWTKSKWWADLAGGEAGALYNQKWLPFSNGGGASQLPIASNEGPMHQVWKEIWSLNVPKKIQQFMWRATNNSLSTKCNLAKRKILPDPICESCRKSHEDTLHALWSCPIIQNAWSPETWLHHVKTSIFQDFADLLVQIFNEGEKH